MFPFDNFVLNLLKSADSKILFADPVQHNDLVIIPVAKISVGLGFGYGDTKEKHGKGAGGGLIAKPIGYIEIKKDRAEFKPIVPFPSFLSLLLAGSISIYLIMKSLHR